MSTPTKNISEYNIELTPDSTSYVFGTKEIGGSVKWVRWKHSDFKWDKGDKWDTGDQWIQGIQWVKWDTGDTGPQWPQWIKGDKWDKGDQGDIGPQWPTWPQGPKWDTGDTWPAGPQGIQWPQGVQGETGPQWPAGPAWAGTGDMLVSNNLSDVTNVATARDNLDVYSTTESDANYQIKETTKQEYSRDIICRVASTANIATLSGTMTIDGIALAVWDYILVKNQTTGANNGVYQVSSWAWTRATEYSTASDLNKKDVYVTAGTANTATWWLCTTLNPTVWTTALVFAQIPMWIWTGATQASAGNHTHTSITATGASSFSAWLTSTGNTIIGAWEFHRYTNRTATGSTATTDNIVVFTGSTASQKETIPDWVAVTSSSWRLITYVNLASVDWTIRVFTSNKINWSSSDIVLKTGEWIQIFNTAVDIWVITNRFRTSALWITDITWLQTALDGTVKTTGNQIAEWAKTFKSNNFYRKPETTSNKVMVNDNIANMPWWNDELKFTDFYNSDEWWINNYSRTTWMYVPWPWTTHYVDWLIAYGIKNVTLDANNKVTNYSRYFSSNVTEFQIKWIDIAPTDWTNVPLQNWRTQSWWERQLCQYRRVANTVQIRWLLNTTGSTSDIAFTLPVWFRPSSSRIFIVQVGWATPTRRLNILNDWRVEVVWRPTNEYVSFEISMWL